MPRQQGMMKQLLPELARIVWGLFLLAISLPIVWMVIQYYRGH